MTAIFACFATNGPGSEPIATWIISTSVFASMPFSLSSLMNNEVLVVGISPVTTFWPLMSLMLSNLKSGAVAIHTAAPFTTLAMMLTGAPLGSCNCRPFRSVDRKLRASGNDGRERDGWRAGGLLSEVEALLGEKPLPEREERYHGRHLRRCGS